MDENEMMSQEEVQAELPLDIPLDMPDLNDPGYIYTITQNDLLDKVIIEEPPVIDGFLMSGVSLLAGAPKVGKSFLVLQIAYHVSTGQPMWGMTVRQSDVLYLALEDTEGRLQRRSARMFGEIGSDHLHFAVAAKNHRHRSSGAANLFSSKTSQHRAVYHRHHTVQTGGCPKRKPLCCISRVSI